MSIITLSRQIWSGAEEIVEMVCQELGLVSVDRDKIGEVVTRFGFEPGILEKYDERKPSLWESLSKERYKLFRAIQIAICQLAQQGKVIIIGRGANILLKDIPGVLRVRIVAPFEARVRNMARTGKTTEEIEHVLRRRDRDSEGFLQHYYDADWNNPFLYDLVINTEKMPYAKAARVIIDTRNEMDEISNVAEAGKKLADLTLKLTIELAVMQHVREGVSSFDVVVDQGNVTMSGFVSNEEVKKDCESAALQVEGVKNLDNQLRVLYIMGT